MGQDRHKLLWDGTDKYVPWTTLLIIANKYNEVALLSTAFVVQSFAMNVLRLILSRHNSRAYPSLLFIPPTKGSRPTGVSKWTQNPGLLHGLRTPSWKPLR